MRTLDWVVLVTSLTSIVFYGLWRSRGPQTVKSYLLAGKTMPWYAMALSIMATQASAITFISTTGQSYVDGMRFVQFYFGLPIAMVILSATVVPIFHRTNVYTAYEYLEQRFDAKTRALVSFIFLIQRGLAVGISLYAPAIVLTILLGWSDLWTTTMMGCIVIAYTTFGGIKAVTWTEFIQMLIIMGGLVVALITAVWMLPGDVSLFDAVTLAGAVGKIDPVVFGFNWADRYNIWSGLLGGTFLALAYFGCDQSQVQRYLTGKSITHSRLSLLFNAVAKVPMQFFILFIGTIVFVFYTFEKPPILFQPDQLAMAQSVKGEYAAVSSRYDDAFDERQTAARELLVAKHAGNSQRKETSVARYRAADQQFQQARQEGFALAERVSGKKVNDTNYIFLTFVTTHLPVGVVGLVMAVIFAATMSSISAEINSLATVSVIDIYQRHIKRDAPDRHYLWVSRVATVFWGAYAVATADYGKNLGSLVEAVNILGSLFYGGMLGVFVLAFLFKRVGGTAAFLGVIAGEAAIFATRWLTDISFLWYNVIGCTVVILAALAVTSLLRPPANAEPA